MAAPFDLDRLAVTGGATGLVDGVMQAANRNLSDMENTLAGSSPCPTRVRSSI